MKELSIREKAARYDEALKKAKDMLSYKEVRREDMESIFTELKESEDERIRKELLNAFQESEDSLYMVLTPQRRESFIAWLKKQGEQILANSAKTCKDEQKSSWSEEDEKKTIRIMYRLSLDGTINNKDLADINNWLKSLKERVLPQPRQEWKPSEEQMTTLRQVISGCSYDIEPLVEMEEQLKKLKEE